ncbi:MBL fold metallo-hydrolase [Anaerorhabdus sp.]|uniref:MBL fold metallo-hydrolase n=1 Tax=Anaerorhabdus sp. TaxID=1872524 RepID=UPI002FCAB18B
MKITALVENISNTDLIAVHGLSLFIETEKHNILFDLGPDDTLFKNANKLNIDLSLVDIVFISHGHFDHGGALKRFLDINTTAKIYIQRKAFEKHFNKIGFFKISVGLDATLINHPQIILVDGDLKIDDELSLFIVEETSKCRSPENDHLYIKEGKDTFLHEQNLIIHEKQTALILGCGHAGLVNILDKAKSHHPQVCVGGYHLAYPVTKKNINIDLLNQIIKELENYPNISFYTCHCTGIRNYEYLASKLETMHYLTCGDMLHFD